MTWQVYQSPKLPSHIRGEFVERQAEPCNVKIMMHRYRQHCGDAKGVLWLIMGGPGDDGLQLDGKIIGGLLRLLPSQWDIHVPRQRGTHFSTSLADGMDVSCFSHEHAQSDLSAWYETYKHPHRNLVYGVSYGSHLAVSALRKYQPLFILDSPFPSHQALPADQVIFERVREDCMQHWACKHLVRSQVTLHDPMVALFAHMALRLERVIVDNGEEFTVDLRAWLLRLLMMDASEIKRGSSQIKFLMRVVQHFKGATYLQTMGSQGERHLDREFKLKQDCSYNPILFPLIYQQLWPRLPHMPQYGVAQIQSDLSSLANAVILTGDLDAHAPASGLPGQVRIKRMGHLALDHLHEPEIQKLLSKVFARREVPAEVSLPPLNWLMTEVPEALIPRWRFLPGCPWWVKGQVMFLRFHHHYPLWWVGVTILILCTVLVVMCLRWYRKQPTLDIDL